VRQKQFVLRPEDTIFSGLRAACVLIKTMLLAQKWVSVVVSEYAPVKTPAQHRTVFLWDTEYAAQLTTMARLTGLTAFWTKKDCHDTLFKAQCMPARMLPLPDGEVLYTPYGLSDKDTTKEMVSEAMDKYQSLAVRYGVDLTQPEAWR
jgi:hypothetical protein